MYSVHHDLVPTIANARNDSTIQSKPTAQLDGFTWSRGSTTPRGRVSAGSQDDVASIAQDGDQPRTLYSKLYERFIEKREVFVHSNIDVRRNAFANQVNSFTISLLPKMHSIIQKTHDLFDLTQQPQAPQHRSSASSSTYPPFANTYNGVQGGTPGPVRHEDNNLLQGYWELSNDRPVERYNTSSPGYYSTGPSVSHTSAAVSEPSFVLTHHPILSPARQSHHQPLPARFHSSYSELSANVAFLSEMKSQSMPSSKGSNAGSPTFAATPPAPHPEPRRRVTPPIEHPTSNRSGTQPRPIARRKNLPDGERQSVTPSPRTSGNKILSGKKGADVRRQPSLACFFCRERKIACGRPAEGSVDRTCKYVITLFVWLLTRSTDMLLVNVRVVLIRAITQRSLCVVSISEERLIRRINNILGRHNVPLI